MNLALIKLAKCRTPEAGKNSVDNKFELLYSLPDFQNVTLVLLHTHNNSRDNGRVGLYSLDLVRARHASHSLW